MKKNYYELSFTRGETTKQITLQIADNKVVELNKTLFLKLDNQTDKIVSNATSVSIVDSRLTNGTYIDASNPPGGLQPLTGSGDESSKLTAMVNYIEPWQW